MLMRLVARRVSDGTILKLVKAILKAPIVEETEKGCRDYRGNNQGTPQGVVLSPLLANLSLNGLDHGITGQKKDWTRRSCAMQTTL
jgi:RNA-directed DNA polymerase